MTLRREPLSEAEVRLHETLGECDRILAVLRSVDLEALQKVNPDWAQAVAEAKDRLRDLGAK